MVYIIDKETEKIIELAKNIDIKLNKDGTVFLDGENVTKEIRTSNFSFINFLYSGASK